MWRQGELVAATGAMVAVGLLAGGAAAAQEVCAEAPLIVELAGAIIDGRGELPRLMQRRHGAEAAFLALHYGGMEEGAARVLLEDLAAEGVPKAQEALAVLVVTREGVEAGLAVIDPDPVRAFAHATQPVRRAVLAADGGESYFRLMRTAEADPELMRLVGDALAGGGEITALVAGMDDAAVSAVVTAAEAAGYGRVALVLASGLVDQTRYRELAGQYPELADGFTGLEVIVARLRNDLGPMPGGDAERTAREARVYELMSAAWEGLPAEFLLTVMNQTGLEAEVAAVATAYRAEVAAGRIDPLRDPEAAWLMQYRGLELVAGSEMARTMLTGFDFPPQQVRHYAGRASLSLDWMLAAEALAPVVRNDVAEMPERPALLSPDFAWEFWSATAQAIAEGSYAPEAGDPTIVVGVELLMSAGLWEEAIALAAGIEPEGRMSVMRDAIQRLDRQCAGWLASPGGVPGAEVMWRF